MVGQYEGEAAIAAIGVANPIMSIAIFFLFGICVGISVLLAVLEKGADTLQTQLSVPASISDIITGIFLFCMLGCEFFINYRLFFRGRYKEVAGK